jgi:hypothetical protein
MAHTQASNENTADSLASYLEFQRKANASATRMATPFTFGLDDNNWKKTVEGDYVPTPELKRPGKKPARPDEALSSHELEQRNRRRERNKLAQQKVRKKMNEQTGELRRQAVNLEIENANLENDIELLSRQRDQIVATFVRHTWVQEILKKSGKLNIEFPDEMKHMPKITLVKLKKTQELVTEELALKAVQGKLKQEDLDEIDDSDVSQIEMESEPFTAKTERT